MLKIISFIKRFFGLVLFCLAVILCAPALATSTCNTSGGGKEVAAGALSIPVNAVPGTVIKSVQTSSIMQCSDTVISSGSYIAYVDLQPGGH